MKFIKERFSYHGGYLMYQVNDGSEPLFIARFKYSGVVTKASFQKQLIKNHTVESYLHDLQINHVAPLVILKNADPDWYQGLVDKFRAKRG